MVEIEAVFSKAVQVIGKCRGADPQLQAKVGHRKARFEPFERIHDLAVGEF